MKEQHLQEKDQNTGTMKGERGNFSMVFSRVRVARLSTAMLFFTVTSVTLGRKREGKRTKNQDKTKE